MTSTEVENPDKYKCALGVWTTEQIERLERCLHFISNMSFKSKTQKGFGIKPFQKGMMITIKGTVFENYSKCRIWIFLILAFSANFCPIKTDLSGNTVWLQASVFPKLAKLTIFGIFN